MAELPSLFDESDPAYEDPASVAAFQKLLTDLTTRCDAAKVKHETLSLANSKSDTYLRIHLPAGRHQRTLDVMHSARAQQLLSIAFEDFVFLDGYLAVRNCKTGDIEAAVDGEGSLEYFRRYMLPQVSRESSSTGDESERSLTVSSQGTSNQVLTLGPPSLEFETLSPDRAIVSLRVSGTKVSQNDQAVRTLESVAAAFLFELDLLLGVTLRLQRHRQGNLPRRRFRRFAAPKPVDPQFPRLDYDFKPLSLYWYGRSARGMPLVQFLAFYQILEFYFPVCSQAEAKRRVRLVLQDPTFRPARDADVVRLLSTIRVAPAGRGFGDERTQLRATFQECLDQDDLRTFLSTEPRRTFFGSGAWNKLSAQKLSIQSAVSELRNELADRIYEIRCRIVHAKAAGSEGDAAPLLPFTEEADLLGQDIELVQYAATKVLVAMAAPLQS